MAISLIATASTDAASGNINFTHGLTIASGDVVIAFINVNGTGNTATDNNGSTPFTETTHGDQPPAGSAVMYIFERVCGASEPSAYAFTLGSSDRSSIVLRQYRGVDSTVWDVAPSGSNISTDDTGGTTSTCSAITILTSGACGIVAMGDDFNPTTTTFSSVNNSYGNVQSESGQQYIVTADKLNLSTGSTGTTVITSSSTVRTVQWQMALKPATDADPNIDAVKNPSFVGVGAQTVTLTIGATLAPALHASTQAGDLLVMAIAGRPAGSTITNTFSKAWTLAGERFREIGTFDLYLGVYYRYAEPGETATTVTPDADFLTSSTTGGVSAQVATYRYTSNVLDVAAAVGDAAAAATWTPPAVTTGTPNCMVISCVATADDNALNHNTANSFTLAMSGASYDTTTGSDHAVGMAYLLKTTAGAVTMNIWNESAVGNDAWVGVTVAFRRKTSMPVYKRPTLFWKRSK